MPTTAWPTTEWPAVTIFSQYRCGLYDDRQEGKENAAETTEKIVNLIQWGI